MRLKPLMLLVMLGTAAGCATAGNTPAQELAWDRWQACQHFSKVSLNRIELDGRLVVTGYESDAAPFTACVREAAADQARRGVTPSPTAAVLVKPYECPGGIM